MHSSLHQVVDVIQMHLVCKWELWGDSSACNCTHMASWSGCGLKVQHSGYCLPVTIKVAPYMSSFQALKQSKARKCGMGWGKRNGRVLVNPFRLQEAVCRSGSAKGRQAWGVPGFGRLGSWRLHLPSTWCVASNTKEWMRETWLQPGSWYSLEIFSSGGWIWVWCICQSRRERKGNIKTTPYATCF